MKKKIYVLIISNFLGENIYVGLKVCCYQSYDDAYTSFQSWAEKSLYEVKYHKPYGDCKDYCQWFNQETRTFGDMRIVEQTLL